MKKNLGFLFLFPVCTGLNAQVGINVTSPTATLDVNGDLRVRSIVETSSNNFVLTADDMGKVKKAPSKEIKGTLNNIYFKQGTSQMQVNEGTSTDVPGLSFTHTVPSTVSSQTLFFTVTGSVAKTAIVGGSAQGVFELYQDAAKISSAYVSVATGDGPDKPLLNLPVSCTLMKAVTLTPGTYTFKVMYTAWHADVIVNYLPDGFAGYNNDKEAMLTKMNVLIFNN